MGVTAAKPEQLLFRNLLPGDPAPWFKQHSTSSPNYAFNSALTKRSGVDCLPA
jgi:hypothetical protein